MRLRQTTQPAYEGYLLQGYAQSLLSYEEVSSLYTRLLRIPCKISAFIERSTIKEAFKYDTFNYFVVDTDDVIWVLNY